MIASIIDTDLYKLTMSAAYFQLFRNAEGTFEFTDRNHTQYTEQFVEKLRARIGDWNSFRLLPDEETYLYGIRYLPSNYVEWLKGFRFDPERIKIKLAEDGQLHIAVTDLMYKATLYEVPILATVSELKHSEKEFGGVIDIDGSCVVDAPTYFIIKSLRRKIGYAQKHDLKFIEFGTRRRYSYDIHDYICEILSKEGRDVCNGTSNVLMAMKYNLTPSGTMAHEWIQFHQGVYGFKRANYLALENWCGVYGGDLGIALTDTFTTDSFLHTLTMRHAKLFDGMRQDSGDEIEVGEKIIERYKSFGIDPATKTVVFSNGLDLEKYRIVADHFRGRIKTVAGIGTNLTCDVKGLGIEPMNIVMKLTRCRFSASDYWEDVIKISDDAGKFNGDPELLEIAKKELHLLSQGDA